MSVRGWAWALGLSGFFWCTLALAGFGVHAALAAPTPVTDDFNRTGPGLGSGWADFTTDGPLLLVSDELHANGSSHLGNYRTGESYADDQYGQVEVTAEQLDNGDFMGPIVRAQNGGDDFYAAMYFCNPSAGCSSTGSTSQSLYLYKRVGGSFTQLDGEVIGPLAAGDVVKVSAVGSTVTAYVNGAEELSVTDTDIPTGGTPGVFGYAFAHLDNFEGGDTDGGGGDTGGDPPGVVSLSDDDRARLDLVWMGVWFTGGTGFGVWAFRRLGREAARWGGGT